MIRKGFTLAEILITMAIIGVVAAITIPPLMTNISEKVKDRQVTVFNSKLIKGLNLTKISGDLNNTYNSTYDFLENGLAKNYKMAKICKSDEIKKCIPYNEIKYERKGKQETIKISEINSAGKLGLSGGFQDIASFISADGVPVIISYNLECFSNPDEEDKQINPCVAGIYDINGSRKPNRFGMKTESVNGKITYKYDADLLSFNNASIGPCKAIIGNSCIVNTYSNWLAYNAIKAVDPDYEKPTFEYNGSTLDDLWLMGKDYCEKVVKNSHAPSTEELGNILSTLYGIEIKESHLFYLEKRANNEKIRSQAEQAIANFQKNKTKFGSSLGINIGNGDNAFMTNTAASDTHMRLWNVNPEYCLIQENHKRDRWSTLICIED